MLRITSFLQTNHGLRLDYELKCVSFSGGVADVIYQDSATNDFTYGDIGIILGRAIRQSKIFEQRVIESARNNSSNSRRCWKSYNRGEVEAPSLIFLKLYQLEIYLFLKVAKTTN